MAVTKDNLRSEVGASATDADTLERCVNVAQTLLDRYIEDGALPDRQVPEVIYDQAHLAVAVDLFNQSQAPNGVLVQQYTDGVGDTAAVPLRISSDPLRPARPLLEPWVLSVGFA